MKIRVFPIQLATEEAPKAGPSTSGGKISALINQTKGPI